MLTEIKVPPLPESVSDAVIVGWHKKPGETIQRDEPLVDLETDKVVLEVPAPCDGQLAEILLAENETVTSGQLLGTLKALATAPAEHSNPSNNQNITPAMGPAVRKLLLEHDLDHHDIARQNLKRLNKEDVLAHLEQQPKTEPTPKPTQPKAETKTEAVKKPTPKAQPRSVTDTEERPHKRVPMTRLRSRIAERLLDVTQNTAMLTTFNEVNMAAVMELRSNYQEAFEKSHNIRLGFMSFFVRAASEALKRFPEINASLDGNEVVYHGFCDIGVAISSERGLVVPILRNSERMSLAEVEKQISAYADKAQHNRLSIDDISGGTFTITNGGVFGSLMSTPILNPPQSAILGMHSIQQRPIAENGQVVIRPMMYLALSYDHRIIDGKSAVQFLRSIKEMLEQPARMLLDL
ncbi:MAG: 2-oxoglutarate dehydrogenase complex dihydrolipoyllysine-residue succinyltransferase [Gammaproteobacteria bacterium]|nr:2-oxoglutarate dehydrogenase complex dihydrolipoyllysine-residue succinyltransferase [Gammaproteobacteria bacterium]